MKTIKSKTRTIREYIYDIIEDNTEEKAFGCTNCDIDESHVIFKDDNNTLFINGIVEFISKYALSHYNLAHNEIDDCCGCFTIIDDNGIIRCNECGKSLHESLMLKLQSLESQSEKSKPEKTKQERIIEKLKQITVHIGLPGEYKEGYSIVKALKRTDCMECLRLSDELVAIEGEIEQPEPEQRSVKEATKVSDCEFYNKGDCNHAAHDKGCMGKCIHFHATPPSDKVTVTDIVDSFYLIQTKNYQDELDFIGDEEGSFEYRDEQRALKELERLRKINPKLKLRLIKKTDFAGSWDV